MNSFGVRLAILGCVIVAISLGVVLNSSPRPFSLEIEELRYKLEVLDGTASGVSPTEKYETRKKYSYMAGAFGLMLIGFGWAASGNSKKDERTNNKGD